MNAHKEDIQALNEFKVTDRPLGVEKKQRKHSEYKLVTALKYLAADKCIELELTYLDGRKFSAFKQNIRVLAKQEGFDIGCCIRDNKIFCFNR